MEKKKEYFAPKMDVLQFDCRMNLLSESGHDEEESENTEELFSGGFN